MLSVFLAFLCPASVAEEITAAFGENRPPFVFGTSQTGLEIDIVREALAVSGHTLKVLHMPNSRLQLLASVNETEIDAVVGVRDRSAEKYTSDPYITFHNYAITRAVQRLVIESVADLENKSVVAWQNAWNDLGREYRRLFDPQLRALSAADYYEHPDQRKQVEMFWKGRMDVIVIDRTLFLWQSNKLAEALDTTPEVIFHDIFAVRTYFYAVFTSRQMRDDFNRGLAALKHSGKYQQLVDAWIR